MERTPLRRRRPRRAKTEPRRSTPLERTPSMVATELQRAAVVGLRCVVCGTERGIDPAHLIARSLGVCGDRCVWCRCAGAVIAPTTAESSTCCRTSSPPGGRSSRTQSGTSD